WPASKRRCRPREAWTSRFARMRQAKEIAGARRTCALLEGTPEACRTWRGQRLPFFVRSPRCRGSRLSCREVAVMAKRSVKRQQWTSLIFALAALLVFGASPARAGTETGARSEERRVGKEGRWRWSRAGRTRK